MDPAIHRGKRLMATLEGCYEARRASALSGVPVSTVYDWARKGVVMPTISSHRTMFWSYADLMALRIVYWLRHPKEKLPDVSTSSMNEVKRALRELENLRLDIWDDGRPTDSPLRVDLSGKIHVVTQDFIQAPGGQLAVEEALDLLGPFSVGEGKGPNLIRPRPTLRIVPGKVSGEPHLLNTRITTKTLYALYKRFGDVKAVSKLYPDQPAKAVAEGVSLERDLNLAA